jgi:hypothetical protein
MSIQALLNKPYGNGLSVLEFIHQACVEDFNLMIKEFKKGQFKKIVSFIVKRFANNSEDRLILINVFN